MDLPKYLILLYFKFRNSWRLTVRLKTKSNKQNHIHTHTHKTKHKIFSQKINVDLFSIIVPDHNAWHPTKPSFVLMNDDAHFLAVNGNDNGKDKEIYGKGTGQ